MTDIIDKARRARVEALHRRLDSVPVPMAKPDDVKAIVLAFKIRDATCAADIHNLAHDLPQDEITRALAEALAEALAQ